MSNYFMLISDRPIKKQNQMEEIEIPTSIQKEINFIAKHAYKLEPVASDRLEIDAKKLAPEFYEKSLKWFKLLHNISKELKKDSGNIVLIATYYDQDLDDIIWEYEKFPIEKFNNEEFSFEFETIYTLE